MSHPISHVWGELARPTHGEFRIGEIATTKQGEPIRVAVGQDGSRHILIPAEQGDLSYDLDGNSLQARIKTVVMDRLEFERFLDIYCVNDSLFETFDRLAAEVIEVAQQSSEPVRDSIKRMSEWKDLFLAKRRRTLAPHQRIGLFAELTVLLEFILSGEISDTSCWTGPWREPHDFEFDTMSLEVKAYGSGSEVVNFHGALQLDSVDDKPLFLCMRQIEEDPDGRSLLDVVDQVEKLVEDSHRFRNTVNRLGILSDDKSLAEIRYRIIKEILVEVTEATPRIVASSFVDGIVPAGIGKLRYSICPEDLIVNEVYSNFETWLEDTR